MRRRIGLVFQEPTLDDRLTAEQNLRFHAVLYHVPRAQVKARIDRVLRLVALEDRRHDLVTADDAAAAAHLEAAGFRVRRGEEQLVVFAEDGEALVPRLIEAAGVRVRTVHVHRPTLDDVFLHYTGRQIRDQSAEHVQSAMARARTARR